MLFLSNDIEKEKHNVEKVTKEKKKVTSDLTTDCLRSLTCFIDSHLTGKCWTDLERIFNGTKYRVGRLTENARLCKITNVLTGQQAVISVLLTF